MGTKALTYIYDEDKLPICCLGTVLDGGVEEDSLGGEIKNLLKLYEDYDFTDNNKNRNKAHYFNGMNCFAAQFICAIKKGKAYSHYLYSPEDLSVDIDQEYQFSIYYNEIEVEKIKGEEINTLFRGTWSEYVRDFSYLINRI